jgi:hypothetical protein
MRTIIGLGLGEYNSEVCTLRAAQFFNMDTTGPPVLCYRLEFGETESAGTR